MTQTHGGTGRYFGQEVKRREDLRHLTGRGRFTDDLSPAGTLHAAVLRSPHAHARIGSVEAEAARKMPGVVAVFTGADLKDRVAPLPPSWLLPGMSVPEHPALAYETVRFVGDGVAVVVAENRYAARDALDLIQVGYEPLPAVLGAEEAAKPGASELHKNVPGNVAFVFPARGGNYKRAAKKADVLVRQRLVNQRVVPNALETRTVLAEYDPGTEHLTVHTSTQGPHNIKRLTAGILRFPEHRLRVVAPDVGGGFGSKLHLYPEEVLCAFLARELERPVKWTESRSESFLATNHGRDHVQNVEVAANRDGTITGVKATVYANLGAYLSGMGPGVPSVNFAMMVSGTYRISNIDVKVYGVLTNTPRVDTYRGAGRPEATYLIERAVDLVARKLVMDPAEVRRKNFIPKDAFPYKAPNSAFAYDSGDYGPNLEKALEMVGYADLRQRQQELRQEGRYLGIGIASYTEFTGIGPGWVLNMAGFEYGGWEYARVVVHPTGAVTIYTGSADHGQGHATSYAQIAADALGLSMEDVEVVEGDTARVQFGNGTFNSRSMPVGGVAIKICCDKIVAKARRIAAHALNARKADVVYDEGEFRMGDASGALGKAARTALKTRRTIVGTAVRAVSGLDLPRAETSGGAVSWAEVARLAHFVSDYPSGLEPGLDEKTFYQPRGMTFPFGTYVAVVEVDAGTGGISFERFVAVDDCGPVINPLLARGQVHGGIAQGIGQALLEGAEYDEAGRPVTDSFWNYAMPRAGHLPRFETAHTVTPSPVNPLGVKGIGEAGTIAAPPAVVNAVVDALSPFGVTHLDMPVTPEKVWRAIKDARREEAPKNGGGA
ncbi:xanthine dehydrogenase family protein molybdopterin-binding subunit [Rubrobacter indicoceani]|uniref:xanthine dehydrogenase family protein molybdopterin-binding subunit n=1 Tax=Rubrobacter indicoceani TaxID=2051957 RepID=UPI000E5A604E|nr:xanthine dehydrogenase family protein molybdopterin-binding subunit [Rubrobacter indicoceani]